MNAMSELRSERSKDKMERILTDKQVNSLDSQRQAKRGLASNHSKLTVIEEKIKMFGGLE